MTQLRADIGSTEGGIPPIDGARPDPLATDATLSQLTSSRVLAWNTVWNLVGQGAPLLVAVVAVPILVHTLGTDRFGVFDLGWLLVGYLSVLDFGLGRALTLAVAEKLGAGDDAAIPPMFWTALLLLLGFGVVGMVLSAAASPWLVHDVLKIPPWLQPEAERAFILLALSLPWEISGLGLRGALEAQQHFRAVNVVRIVMGLITFLAPLAVLPFSHSLVPIVTGLVIVRPIIWLAMLVLNVRAMPTLRHRRSLAWSKVRPLLRTGGWMSVSNIISLLMVGLDRFLIGAVISVTAVTYYGTPYDVVTKLLIVPWALTGVLFPAFAASFSRARAQTRYLFDGALRITFVVLYPIILLIVAFAGDFLRLWLGGAFPQQSTHVLQWLAVGVLANCVAQLPLNLIQGCGRSDITALVSLGELPFYGGLLWLMVERYGITGAAIAWAVRASLEAVVLLAVANRLLGAAAINSWRLLLVLGAVVTLGAAALPLDLTTKALLVLATLIATGLATWQGVLTANERALVRVWRRSLPWPFWSRERSVLP